jgi:nicotinamide riboside kinase
MLDAWSWMLGAGASFIFKYNCRYDLDIKVQRTAIFVAANHRHASKVQRTAIFSFCRKKLNAFSGKF